MTKKCVVCQRLQSSKVFSKQNATCNPCLKKVKANYERKKQVELEKRENKGITYFEKFLTANSIGFDFSNRKM